MIQTLQWYARLNANLKGSAITQNPVAFTTMSPCATADSPKYNQSFFYFDTQKLPFARWACWNGMQPAVRTVGRLAC